MNQFDNVIVNKPWGYEYLVYENKNVGIWYLNINYKGRTSLHAHPNKKTGLIILSGVAKVSFLNHGVKLTASDKTMIRHGVFHSTEALSKQGLEVLEIETPKDKTDLVRLEDYYGREGTPYEDPSQYESTYITTLQETPVREFGDCKLTLDENLPIDKYHLSVILEGGVKYKEYPVLSHGDIVDNSTLKRLSNKFDVQPSKIIGVSY